MTALPTPAAMFTLEPLLRMVIAPEWFDSTKEKRSETAALTGLLDYGLLADKVPNCVTSAGLTAIASTAMSVIRDETDDRKLKDRTAEAK